MSPPSRTAASAPEIPAAPAVRAQARPQTEVHRPVPAGGSVAPERPRDLPRGPVAADARQRETANAPTHAMRAQGQMIDYPTLRFWRGLKGGPRRTSEAVRHSGSRLLEGGYRPGRLLKHRSTYGRGSLARTRDAALPSPSRRRERQDPSLAPGAGAARSHRRRCSEASQEVHSHRAERLASSEPTPRRPKVPKVVSPLVV